MKTPDTELALLFPILPKFLKRIYNGGKRWEYRRRRPARPWVRGIICACNSNANCLAEFKPGRIITGDPQEVWERTRWASGLHEPEFNAYVGNRDKVTAIEITYICWYDEPDIYSALDVFAMRNTPQSFVYVPVPPWRYGRPSEKQDPAELFPNH